MASIGTLLIFLNTQFVAERSALTTVRDLRCPTLTNPILYLDKCLERYLPDHSITRGLVNPLGAGTSNGSINFFVSF
jgi:hypothetical protein